MLCEVCHEIFRNSYPSKPSDHHFSVHELQQAALRDCYICGVLWYGVSDLPPDHPKANIDAPNLKRAPNTKPISKHDIRHRAVQGNEILELSFAVDRNGVDNGGRSFTFPLQAKSGGCSYMLLTSFLLTTSLDSHDLLAAKGTSGSTDWLSSMECASKWLSRCLRSHNKCQTAHSTEHTRFSPTRLLEIGQSDPQKVRLRLSLNQDSNNTQYATLSHCWGASKVLKLTSTTFERLKTGIEISELAQTAQDAIFTARSLGIHLLWIDSLCIFQDSQEDWQQEAALMSHVYKNSTLNIAASVAADSNASCFPKKDTSSIEPCMVQTAWIDKYNDTYHLYYDDFWDATLKKMPLTKRAWVVQELLLAPRVLHLCGKQLFWECYELCACETYPDGTPPSSHLRWVSGDARWHAFIKTGTRHVAVENDSNCKKTTLLELWHGIVELYTSCNLTYTTDKLVALSGVAKLMEQALDDEYCAGLWRSRLVTELFWFGPLSNQGLSLRPSPYRAPSWSWACLDGHISPGGYHTEGSYGTLKPLVDIISCDSKTATGDRTGAVMNGSLKISGWLASVQLRPDPECMWKIYFDGKWWKNKRGSLYIRLDCIFSSSEIHCLPLFVDIHQAPNYFLACLLLSPTGNRKGQFQRIGALGAFSGALGLNDWAQFRNVANEPWLQYETPCGNDMYTISIV